MTRCTCRVPGTYFALYIVQTSHDALWYDELGQRVSTRAHGIQTKDSKRRVTRRDGEITI